MDQSKIDRGSTSVDGLNKRQNLLQWTLRCSYHVKAHRFQLGGNEYRQCGEEPERKEPIKRDIVIPKRCAPKLSVRQKTNFYSYTCTRSCKCEVNCCGAFHNLSLLEDGVLMAWGNNEYGQLKTGDTQPKSQSIVVQGLSGLTLVYGCGRGEHGRLGFGDDKSSKMAPQKVQLLDGENIVQVSCGGTHSIALTQDGRMFSKEKRQRNPGPNYES